jgi:long-subunit acyl-CoA synthetase (AMP-forming)
MSTPMTETTITETDTLCRVFAATAVAHADAPALRSADGEVEWTWHDYAERARAASAGLAGIGVHRGDTVALWLANRPEFHVADTAASMLGAAPFSVYATFTVEQAEHVIRDAGSRILITELAYLDRALALRARGRTQLELIVLVDGGHTEALTWDELLASAPAGFDVDAAAGEVRPDDLATLIYTSGTTGPPKGVELTHANVIAQTLALGAALRLSPRQRAISWLPMAHIAERLCTQYMPMALGWSVTCLSDPRAIAAVLPEVRPEFFFSPPRLWEKLRAATIAKLGDRPDPRPALAALGLDAARVVLVGAAPCPAEVIHFWHGLGLKLCEVYGMSETTGVATINPPDAVRVGTVGTPVPGVEVTLSENGEVLIRGAVIMRGYRNQPAATAEAIDPAGWMHSGDVGVIDDGGYLQIVDRIKELIINAAGKNMSPVNIEATVKAAGELIGNVCCVGDARPYNVALITLDPDAAVAFAQAKGLPDASLAALAADERVRAEVAAAVQRANEALARVEQIKRFTLLGDWIPGGEELTPTMKLRRKPIAAIYAAEIEAMYEKAHG